MIKVVIADDDQIVCNGIKSLIDWNEFGAEVVGIANNGEEALDMALSIKPDIVITDIKMPVMDGLELCKEINHALNGTSIVLMSAFEDFSYAQTAIKYGVKDYIVKPIDREKLDQLIGNIQRLVSEHSRRLDLYGIVYYDDFKTEVFKSMKSGNIEFILDIINNKLDTDNSSFDVVKEWCAKFIDILFEFMEYIGVEHTVCVKSKKKTFQEFINLKAKSDVIVFTERIYTDILQFKSDKKDSRMNLIIRDLQDFIEKNYPMPDMNVSFVSRKFNISSNYLSILFRQMTGMNISSYITGVRIRKAKEFLCDPYVSVLDVASMVGYSDSHYFARVFKKTEGMTPSEYRHLRCSLVNK